MKKKILMGSLIAAVIVIGISFTSVVGYRKVESNVMVSPLFNIRTNKAIGMENKVLNCKYESKGITIPIPRRNNKVLIIQKIIDSINTMNDGTFGEFIGYVLNNALMNKEFNDVNPDMIREALYLLRYSDKSISIINRVSKNTTFYYGFKGLLGNTFSEPFCFIINILAFIARLILKIICELSGTPVGSVVICPPQTI